MSMHFTWQSAVLKSDCESTTKFVLLVVGTYMNQHGGGAFPSYGTLAASASLGRSTIIKHIDIAAEKGWIRKTVRPRGNQDNDTNVYEISYPYPSSSNGLGGIPGGLGSACGGLGVVHLVDPNTTLVTPQRSPQKKDRATRLPDDWMPGDADVLFCRKERPDLDVERVALEFRDYWIAVAGDKGRKADWPATWRNWVRRQRGDQTPRRAEKFDPVAHVNRNRFAGVK